jgi:hypothetical protein
MHTKSFSAPAIKLASFLKFSPACGGDYGGGSSLQKTFQQPATAETFDWSLENASALPGKGSIGVILAP